MKRIRYMIPESWKRKLYNSSLMKWYARKQFCSPEYPKVISILTGIYPCIYNCRMCPQFSKKPDKKIHMPFTMFKKIIDQLPSTGVSIELSSYGETLMVEDFAKMIKYSKENRSEIPICIATNGLLLNNEVIDMLINTKVDTVQVSLNAADKEAFNWLMGVDAYDKASENIKKFAKRKKELGVKKPEIYTHLIDIKELQSKKSKNFTNEWNKIVDRADIRPLGNWGGYINEHGCSRNWTLPEKRYPCSWPWFNTKIMPTGEVHKCFIHFLSGKPGVGNINRDSLQDIWKGTKLQEVRKRHLEGRYKEEPLCGECDVWALFPNIFD